MLLRTMEEWGPSSSLDLKVLTIKTVTLLAVVTGRRCSSLALLSTKPEYMQISESGATFQPVGFEKQSRPAHSNKPIELQAYNKNPGMESVVF